VSLFILFILLDRETQEAQSTTSAQYRANTSQYLQSNVLPSMISPMKRPSNAESQPFDRSERLAPPPECSIQPPLIQPYPLTSNVSSLRQMLERDINTVLTIAEDYNNKMVQYVALDEGLLELLPKLYFIELKKIHRGQSISVSISILILKSPLWHISFF
jgi:hypothetical protein